MGRLLLVLFDRNELEIMVVEIEQAGRRAVGERNRHAAFAGRETVVADCGLAVQLGQLRHKHADRSASPHREDLQIRPGMFRQQRAVRLGKLLQLASSRADCGERFAVPGQHEPPPANRTRACRRGYRGRAIRVVDRPGVRTRPACSDWP